MKLSNSAPGCEVGWHNIQDIGCFRVTGSATNFANSEKSFMAGGAEIASLPERRDFDTVVTFLTGHCECDITETSIDNSF